MNKKNYDYVIIWVILTCHFIYLGNFSNLFFYGIYDYYLGVGNTFHDFFWYPSYAYINKINVFDKFLNITPFNWELPIHKIFLLKSLLLKNSIQLKILSADEHKNS
jgi:hypothetical protein